MDAKHLVVFVTTPTMEIGEQIARTLVEAQLAAGINLIPEIKSIYTWEGKIYNEAEVMMVIKTQARLFETLVESVQSLHPFEVPEIIALPIVAGSANYLAWIEAVTS